MRPLPRSPIARKHPASAAVTLPARKIFTAEEAAWRKHGLNSLADFNRVRAEFLTVKISTEIFEEETCFTRFANTFASARLCETITSPTVNRSPPRFDHQYKPGAIGNCCNANDHHQCIHHLQNSTRRFQIQNDAASSSSTQA